MVDMSKINFKLDMVSLLDILGGLDNASLRPSDDAVGKQFDLPPILVWNYLKEDPEIIHLISDAVQNYPWKDPWIFEKIRNKWLLYPKKVREVNTKLKLGPSIYDDAMIWLMENEPEFGQRTNKDLHKFTEYFEAVVRKYLDDKAKP